MKLFFDFNVRLSNKSETYLNLLALWCIIKDRTQLMYLYHISCIMHPIISYPYQLSGWQLYMKTKEVQQLRNRCKMSWLYHNGTPREFTCIVNKSNSTGENKMHSLIEHNFICYGAALGMFDMIRCEIKLGWVFFFICIWKTYSNLIRKANYLFFYSILHMNYAHLHAFFFYNCSRLFVK